MVNPSEKNILCEFERISREEKHRAEFDAKWGCMLKYYVEQQKALKKLKAIVEAKSSTEDQASIATDSPTIVLPRFPQTSSQEIGWLSGNSAYALEVAGPCLNTRPSKMPNAPPGLLPLRDIDFHVNWYQTARNRARKTTGIRKAST